MPSKKLILVILILTLCIAAISAIFLFIRITTQSIIVDVKSTDDTRISLSRPTEWFTWYDIGSTYKYSQTALITGKFVASTNKEGNIYITLKSGFGKIDLLLGNENFFKGVYSGSKKNNQLIFDISSEVGSKKINELSVMLNSTYRQKYISAIVIVSHDLNTPPSLLEMKYEPCLDKPECSAEYTRLSGTYEENRNKLENILNENPKFFSTKLELPIDSIVLY